MTPPKSDWRERFRKLIGNAPESVDLEKITGRKTCFICGHPFNGDKVVSEIETFIAQEIEKARAEEEKEAYVKYLKEYDRRVVEEIGLAIQAERKRIRAEERIRNVWGDAVIDAEELCDKLLALLPEPKE